jgi:hypothetical protein
MTYVGKKPADIIATAVDTTTGTFSGDLTVDTNTLYVDSANNNVGIGTVSPNSSWVSANNLVISDTSSDGGMTILSGTSGNGNIMFSDTTAGAFSDARGLITYLHASDAMRFHTANTEAMRIDSSGNVGIGTTNPATFSLIPANRLVVGTGSSDEGITIYSSTSTAGTLAFADGTSGDAEYRGFVQYHHNGDYMRFYTAATERMRIDSNGNVGIGVTPFANNIGTGLDIASGAGMFGSSNSNYLTGNLYYSSGWKYKASASGSMLLLDGNGTIKFHNAPSGTANGTATLSERMRIDSSGNLLVGCTAVGEGVGNTNLGITVGSFLSVSRDGGTVGYFNRNTSDGDIVQLRKDGSLVGNIGTSNGDLYIGTGDTGLRFHDGDNSIYSVNATTGAKINGAIDLGESAGRFKDLYLSGGVYLGGTGSANKISDFEQGSWTPSNGGNTSYGSREGLYIKVGNAVFIFGVMEIASIGTGDTREISGLPFASTRECTIPLSKLQNSTFNFHSVQLRTSGSSLFMSAQTALDGSIDVNQHYFQNSTIVQFSGTYITA